MGSYLLLHDASLIRQRLSGITLATSADPLLFQPVLDRVAGITDRRLICLINNSVLSDLRECLMDFTATFVTVNRWLGNFRLTLRAKVSNRRSHGSFEQAANTGR